MANRFIKESIWDSPNLNRLSCEAERYFYRLLPLPDDHGCFQATPIVVKCRLFPLKPDITEENCGRWNYELQETSVCRFWVDGERLYGQFINWEKHQRIRSLHNRKTPPPPTTGAGWCQLTTTGAFIPIPIPIPILIPSYVPNGTLSGEPDEIPENRKPVFKIPYEEIIDFLNEKSGKQFSSNSKGTKRLIKARWNEGHRLEDFLTVIVNKCEKWAKDPEMMDYLRPETLFSTSHFESYLNEQGTKKLNISERRLLDNAIACQEFLNDESSRPP